MSIIGSNILAGASGAEAAYTIDQSMYFGDAPSTSPKMSRQFDQTGSANPKWTFATWLKKGPPDTGAKVLYYCRPLAISTGADLEFSTSNDAYPDVGNGGFRNNSWAAGSGDPTWDWSTYRDELSLLDYSAFYHICHVIDYTTSPYVFLYINGVLMDPDTIYVTKTGAGYGTDFSPQSGDTFFIGSNYSNQCGNAYFADTYWIEQQALNPVGTFGEFSEDTGQFVPIKYTGTYSGNSFYLDYADSADFGTDRSGLGNDFTVVSIAARQQVPDSPTNNFANLNPLVISQSVTGITEGNLVGTGLTSSKYVIPSTMGVGSGKWYWETLPVTGNDRTGLGIITGPSTGDISEVWEVGNMFWFYGGEVFTENVLVSASSPFSNDDVLGLALDVDAQTLALYVNNVLGYTVSFAGKFLTAPSINPAINVSTDSEVGKLILNFGQDSSFVGEKTAQGNQDSNGIGDFYYAPPTDFLAICASNLPDPAIALPGEHFNSALYVGNDTNPRAITGIGFQPDFVWTKNRETTYTHCLADSVIGVEKFLISDLNNTVTTDAQSLLSFDSDGYTLGTSGSFNTDGVNADFVSWSWKAGTTFDPATAGTVVTGSGSSNATAGFSVVSYEGTGAVMTIGHGLSSAPELIMVKNRDAADDWQVYCAANGSAPETDYLVLNSTAATVDNVDRWNDALPSATVFTVGDGVEVNT